VIRGLRQCADKAVGQRSRASIPRAEDNAIGLISSAITQGGTERDTALQSTAKTGRGDAVHGGRVDKYRLKLRHSRRCLELRSAGQLSGTEKVDRGSLMPI